MPEVDSSPPTGESPRPAPVKTPILPKVVRRFTYPAESPLTAITIFYILLAAVGWLAYRFVPGAAAAFTGERLQDLMSGGGSFLELTRAPDAAMTGMAFSLQFALALAAAMVGAGMLMIPSSWVYMATHRTKGMDQNVVQTMLILALSVAGVIVIVRNSLALAFSLAGVVGAVRYRHTLRDPRDTLYVFIAIGVGLAAGVEALPAAAALSLVFNYAILFMARADYAMCELGHSCSHLLLTTPIPADADPTADGPGKFGKSGKSGKKEAKIEFNAVLVVRAAQAAAAREKVEPFLTAQARRWQLAEIETNSLGGKSHLKYLLRLGRKQDHSEFEDALLATAAPHIVGAKIH